MASNTDESSPNPYAAPVPVDAVPEQDWGTGTVIGNAWKIYAEHFRLFGLVALLVWLPIEVVMVLWDDLLLESSGVSGWLLNIIFAFATQWLPEAIALCIARSVIAKEKPTFRNSFRQGVGVWLWLAWTNLIATIVVSLGFILLIVPGIFLSIRFSLCNAVVVDERLKGTVAMRRSFDMTGSHFWPLLGLTALMIAVVAGLSSIDLLISGPIQVHSNWTTSLGWQVTMAVIQDTLMIFPSLCFYFYYHRIKMDEVTLEPLVPAAS
ncbi:hypothetical protein K227x_48360 [Rubripirellula lacrimiformis]|uniref:Membrane domain of glycerophosphoryl diester phosphodiesterase n=1 Tax=Rubripirellula lacrimiformis TaxID=1930273 RepID=A0A517NH15_9BACT|nr:hypothetical protein [Rubripirellula lacrimiformis]QDT06426.1 hypothetical protein K227x_48360 [Rubripirellula lacrimiformis]